MGLNTEKGGKIQKVRPETIEFIHLLEAHKKSLGMGNLEIALLLGYKSAATITEIVKKRQNIDPDALLKFKSLLKENSLIAPKEYPAPGDDLPSGSEMSSEGAVDMLKVIQGGRKIETFINKGVPYYDVEITASVVRSFSDVREKPEYFIDFQPFNDATAWLPIYGDSMYPKFQAGEMVAVKQIFNFDSIQWGEAHMIVTNEAHNNLRTIKNVHYCEDETKIILRSVNPEYGGPIPIFKRNILSMYIVKGQAKKSQY